jgi:hypothetical protein
MQSRLHDRFGSRGDGAGGLAHYRALYATDSGDYKAFRVVPGATIAGSAAAGTETVALATDVEIEGASFSYEREVAVADGQFRRIELLESLMGASATSIKALPTNLIGVTQPFTTMSRCLQNTVS